MIAWIGTNIRMTEMIPKWELGVGGFSSIIFNLDYATKVSVSMPVLIYHKKFGTDVFVLGHRSQVKVSLFLSR